MKEEEEEVLHILNANKQEIVKKIGDKTEGLALKDGHEPVVAQPKISHEDLPKPNHTENSKLKRAFYQLTVEPTMFLYMMAFMLTTVVEQFFFVYKACRVDHGYSEEICHSIEKHEAIKTEVQKTVSLFYQWEGIASRVIPIILALFLGAWSDKRGRKLPLILGLIGKLIYSVMIIVNANQPTWPLKYIIYTATIPCAFTGADLAIFASCYAYISDVSSVKNRTLRITILDVSYLITMPTGVAIGSQLYRWFNRSFSWMFACNVALMVLAILYSSIRLRWKTTDGQKLLSEVGYSNFLADFFDKKHAIRSIEAITKNRPDKTRSFIWLLFICMGFYTFQRNEVGMLFLFTQLKLNWDTHIYSCFRTYQSLTFVLMMLISIPLKTKLLKWPDTVLIMIGSVSHAAGRIFFVFAKSTLFMYIGATVSCLGPITASAIRSMISKLVPVTDRGVVFAVLSVFDNAVPLISATMYSQLYNATINVYPESIFWLTFVTQIVVLLLVSVIHLKGGVTKNFQEQPKVIEVGDVQEKELLKDKEIEMISIK